jgi:hypothetical protein
MNHSIDSFSDTLKRYQEANPQQGSLVLNIHSNCDDDPEITIYHMKPLSEADRAMLELRRHEILDRNTTEKKNIIKKFLALQESDPQWTAQELEVQSKNG